MLKSIFGSVKELLNKGDKEEARKKLFDAVNKAAEDGVITLEEYQEIEQMQEDLHLSEEEFYEVKIKVLENMMERLQKDGTVTDMEMEIFEDVKSRLNIKAPTEIPEDDDKKAGFLKEQSQVLLGHLYRAKEKADKGIKSASERLYDLSEDATKAISEKTEEIKKKAPGTKTRIFKKLYNVADDVGERLDGFKDRVEKKAPDVKDKVFDKISDTGDEIVDRAGKLRKKVSEKAPGVRDKVVDNLSDAGEEISEKVGDWKDSLVKRFRKRDEKENKNGEKEIPSKKEETTKKEDDKSE